MKTYREWTDEEIAFLKLNYPRHGAKYSSKHLNRPIQSIRSKVRYLDLQIDRKTFGVTYEIEELKQAIEESNCYSEVIRKFNRKVSGKSMIVLKRWIAHHGLDDAGLKQWKCNTAKSKKVDEYLINGIVISSSNLKKKLYAAGIKKEICEECGQLPEWNGKKLILQLDHVNGDHYDNRIENLKILCPNCHTQTVTFSRGVGKLKQMEKKEVKRQEVKQQVLLDRNMNGGHTSKQVEYKLSIRKIERPSHEKLMEMVKELGYCEVGRMHGVSDNAIRKWIRTYEKQNGNSNTTVV